MIKVTSRPFALFFWFLMLGGIVATAQTSEQVQKITSSYNKANLQELATQSLQKSEAEKKVAVAYAQARNIPIAYTTDDGTYVELQSILPDGTLIYYQTHNQNAAHATRTDHLNSGGSTGYNLDGQNMIAYVWDAGHPLVAHQEFFEPGNSSRVSIMDEMEEGGIDLQRHPTHVIGTITASGIVPAAKGMAPKSAVKAYKWTNDLAEATNAALNGILVSNHSYGYATSTIKPENHWMFGAYNDRARDWDNLMYHAPYYLMVNSAGNDGSNHNINANPLESGYDKLSGFGVSKNNLVIASAQAVTLGNDGTFISAENSPFSSQGPTDDLRIKPDLAGYGFKVLSTDYISTDSYRNSSGTSMAAPNVTGSLLLLQQHYNNLNGDFMRAATLKGLVLHTADDFGPVGPDAVSGWGLLNAKKAAETISENGSGTLIQELNISQGQTIAFTVQSDGSNPLLASISWTDRAGRPNHILNSDTAILVNDLDIKVEQADSVYYPWRLTSATTNSKEGDNEKDPFERVDVVGAIGTYLITITHKGSLVSGNQPFSLIITGILPVECEVASVPENFNVTDISTSEVKISWQQVQRASYDLRYRKAETDLWIEISDISTNYYEISNLDSASQYEVQVRSKCNGGETSDYSAPFNFSTIALEYCESRSNEPSDPTFYISNVNLNTLDHDSGKSQYSDFTDLNTELVAGETYSISITTASNVEFATRYAVWIDYNSNGNLDDLQERIFVMSTVDTVVASGSFTVPVDIKPIPTRMRVSMISDNFPAEPCDIFAYGEVEDYTINLRLPTDFIYENEIWTPKDPAGVSTSMDNIHIINGAAVFSTDINAKNIRIDPEATLYVEGVLTIAGNISNEGNFVFVSTASGNGELAAVPSGSSISGNATVQRYFGNRRAYRMVSSAITTPTSIHGNWQEGAISNTHNPAPGFGTHITGSTTDQHNGFDGTQLGTPSMYTVDVGTQQFMPLLNTDQLTLDAGNPYLMYIRGDRSIDLNDNSASGETILRATGSLYYGQHIQNFGEAGAGNFVMFGNPYQSAVDITSVLANSTNVNTNYYYIYDPYNATHGNYITVDLSIPSPLQYLQPGQAAQVEVLGPATVRFNESDKSPGNFTAIHRSNSGGGDNLRVQLYTAGNFISGGPLHDELTIKFATGNDNGITAADALKPMNFYENFGIDVGGTILSLEKRNMPGEDEILQLYNGGYQYSDYTLKIDLEGMDDHYFYLYDALNDSSTQLSAGENLYNFTIDQNNPLSIASSRFSIRTATRLRTNANPFLSNVILSPNPMEGNVFYISAPNLDGEILQISIHDIAGRRVYEERGKFIGSKMKISLKGDLAGGLYLVTLVHNRSTKTFRLVKK